MKELFRKRFKIWVQMQWIKTIYKELKKRDIYYEKYNRATYVAKKLLEEYYSKFGKLHKSEDTE